MVFGGLLGGAIGGPVGLIAGIKYTALTTGTGTLLGGMGGYFFQ